MISENRNGHEAQRVNTPEASLEELQDYLKAEPSPLKQEALKDVIDTRQRELDRKNALYVLRTRGGDSPELKSELESQLRVKETSCGTLDHEIRRKRLDPQTGESYDFAYTRIAQLSNRVLTAHQLSDHKRTPYTKNMAEIDTNNNLLKVLRPPKA